MLEQKPNRHSKQRLERSDRRSEYQTTDHKAKANIEESQDKCKTISTVKKYLLEGRN